MSKADDGDAEDLRSAHPVVSTSWATLTGRSQSLRARAAPPAFWSRDNQGHITHYPHTVVDIPIFEDGDGTSDEDSGDSREVLLASQTDVSFESDSAFGRDDFYGPASAHSNDSFSGEHTTSEEFSREDSRFQRRKGNGHAFIGYERNTSRNNTSTSASSSCESDVSGEEHIFQSNTNINASEHKESTKPSDKEESGGSVGNEGSEGSETSAKESSESLHKSKGGGKRGSSILGKLSLKRLKGKGVESEDKSKDRKESIGEKPEGEEEKAEGEKLGESRSSSKLSRSRSGSRQSRRRKSRSKGDRKDRKSKDKSDKSPESKDSKETKPRRKSTLKKNAVKLNQTLFSKDPPYPASVYFILGSEFCERFTYFGLRTILVLYLTSWLGLAKNQATAVFHLFSSFAYFSPIIGAIIADSFLGRYKTILYISFIYAVGCIILSVTAYPPRELIGPFIGLFLISLGTGGIKPCVVTFGGDQFSRKQIKRKATFFSTFYFVINIGSLLSTVVTPVLRSDVHCVDNSCYPLAFGVPALLMTLALSSNTPHTGMSTRTECLDLLFIHLLGSIRIMINHSRLCFTLAMGSTYTYLLPAVFSQKPSSVFVTPWGINERPGAIGWMGLWKEFVDDVKMLTRLIWLFLPLPVFWALFNQQGSRWTLQAAQLDGRFSFLGRLKPEQMQALNPLFIVLLIPVFERVIYPCLSSCGIPNRPLQRMVSGMFFAAVAFTLAAVLQMRIQDTVEKPVAAGRSGYIILNTVDCKMSVRGSPAPFYFGNVPPFGQTTYQAVTSNARSITVSCPATGLEATTLANLTSGKAYRIVITSEPGFLRILVLDEMREKSTNGTGFVSFLHLMASVDTVKIRVASTHDEVESVVMKVSLANATHYNIFEPGSYQLAFPSYNNLNSSGWENVGKPFEVGSGGIYTVALIDPATTYDFADVVVETYVDVKENSLSMILMIPQYLAITIGEILFSISGLSFAYTQSPESMKSIIQACWLLTTSAGDLIVVLVAETKLLPNQVDEFLLFASMMMVTTIVFALMTLCYGYVDRDELKAKKSQKKGEEKRDKQKTDQDSGDHSKKDGKDSGKRGKGKKKKGKDKKSKRKKKKKSSSEEDEDKDKKGKRKKKKKSSSEEEDEDKDKKDKRKKKKKSSSEEEDEEKGKKDKRKKKRKSSSEEEDEDKDKKGKRKKKKKSSSEEEDEDKDKKGKRKKKRKSSSEEDEDKDKKEERKKRRKSSSKEQGEDKRKKNKKDEPSDEEESEERKGRRHSRRSSEGEKGRRESGTGDSNRDRKRRRSSTKEKSEGDEGGADQDKEKKRRRSSEGGKGRRKSKSGKG